MNGPCPFICNNKTEYGYCKTTGCINICDLRGGRMSITIDDMKMPKSCMVCPFEHNGDCYGGKPKRIMDIEDFKDSRHLDCPLMEAEPKHGRWIWNKRLGEWYCSNCDRIMKPYIVEKSEGEYEMAQPFYCGWCGSRMDEVEE